MRKWTLLCLLAAFALAEEEQPDPDAAPAFTLRDVNGKEHTLKGYEGKLVVLEWINHGCPYVKKHYGSKNMQKLQEAYTKKGVVWLSICSSAPGKQGHMSPEDWKKKNEEVGSKATAVLIDADGKVGKAYNAKVTPQMCVIDKKGVRVYDGAIDDTRSANPEDIKTSKNYVAEALDALLAGKPAPVRKTTPYG